MEENPFVASQKERKKGFLLKIEIVGCFCFFNNAKRIFANENFMMCV